MAKAIAHQRLETLIVPFSLVVWFPERNMADRTTKFDYESAVAVTLIKSFAERAWDKVTSEGMAMVTPITDADIERAVTDRKVLLETAEREKLAKPIRNEVLKRLLLDDKGNIVKPQYCGVSGNRRSLCFPEGLIKRVETYEGEVTPEIFDQLVDPMISISVKHFQTDMERTLAQVRENMGKTEGFEKPSWRSILGTGRTLIALGASQTQVRDAFTDAEGQRIHGLTRIDVLLPELNLFPRILDTKEDNADYINYTKIKYSDLPPFVRRLQPEVLAEFNEKQLARGKAVEQPADLTELDKYFRDVTTGTRDKSASMMDRSSVERLQKQNPIIIVQRMAEMILKNETRILEPLLALGQPLNDVVKIGDWGPDSRPIFKLLDKVTHAADQEVRDNLLRQVAELVKE